MDETVEALIIAMLMEEGFSKNQVSVVLKFITAIKNGDPNIKSDQEAYYYLLGDASGGETLVFAVAHKDNPLAGFFKSLVGLVDKDNTE